MQVEPPAEVLLAPATEPDDTAKAKTVNEQLPPLVSASSPAATQSSVSRAASMYLSSSSAIRWGLGIVAIILIIYIFATVRSIMNGPVGQAVGNIIGAAGGILAAIAGLPPWLLIGLGFAYLLSPAILKMGGAAARQLSTAVKDGNAKVESLKGSRSQDYLDAYAKGMASEAIVRIRQSAPGADDGSSAAYERLATAKAARASAISDAAGKGGDAIAGDSDGANEAKKYFPDE